MKNRLLKFRKQTLDIFSPLYGIPMQRKDDFHNLRLLQFPISREAEERQKRGRREAEERQKRGRREAEERQKRGRREAEERQNQSILNTVNLQVKEPAIIKKEVFILVCRDSYLYANDEQQLLQTFP